MISYPSNVKFHRIPWPGYQPVSYVSNASYILDLTSPTTYETIATYTVVKYIYDLNTNINPPKLQILALPSNNSLSEVAIYSMYVRYIPDTSNNKLEEYALCGRNTLSNKQAARKLLSHGLGSADYYDKSLSEIKKDTLYAFAYYITSSEFNVLNHPEEVKKNTETMNTWLVKILGK